MLKITLPVDILALRSSFFLYRYPVLYNVLNVLNFASFYASKIVSALLYLCCRDLKRFCMKQSGSGAMEITSMKF